MKQNGYTLLELLIAVSILLVITGISLVGIASPRTMLEKESMISEITQILTQAQLTSVLRGTTVTLSFTPVALWIDEVKRLEFNEASGFRWKTDISKLVFHGNGDTTVLDSNGRSDTLSKAVQLTYNQKAIASVQIDSDASSFKFVQLRAFSENATH
jgi:prepilin-type N-terminal cleavage/methylation domain-containing protein